MKIMNLPETSHQPANDNESTREDIFKEVDILVGREHEHVLNLTEYYEEGGKVWNGIYLECLIQACPLIWLQIPSPNSSLFQWHAAVPLRQRIKPCTCCRCCTLSHACIQAGNLHLRQGP